MRNCFSFSVVITVVLLCFSGFAFGQNYVFYEDFQDYDVEYSADFSIGGIASGNWFGTNTTDASACRIFSTGNFGGTKLWITNVDDSGLVSRAIQLQSGLVYTFSAAIVSETSVGSRQMSVSYNLLIGADYQSAVSVIGGPVIIQTHGDDWEIDNSKQDHIFTCDFTTGQLNASDRLFIEFIDLGLYAGSAAWVGVDDVIIQRQPVMELQGNFPFNLREGDATAFEYSVVLKKQPTADVTVTVDPWGADGSDLDLGAGSGVAVELNFTTSNWDTAQSVYVTAVDDDILERFHSGLIINRASSADSEFNGVEMYVDVNIEDNDAIINSSDAFVNGQGGHAVYRIPSMTVCKDGSIIGAAEGRPNTGDPGASGDIAMVVRRSTDGGLTWGDYVDVNDTAGFDYSDPRLVVDDVTGRVHLLYTQWPTRVGQASVPVAMDDTSSVCFHMYSDDNGISWSIPININQQIKDSTWHVVNTGPGIAIQLKYQNDPAKNGRLIMASHNRNGSGSYNGAPIYSDDNGLTWHIGAETGSPSVNESEMVELTNGDLMWDGRPWSGSSRPRFYSSDGGQTWGDYTAGDVPSVVCDYGIDRFSAKRDGDDRDRIVIAGPLGNPAGSASGRVNVGLWTSYDEGKSFINPVQLENFSAAYTVVDKLVNGNVAVFYEVDGYTKIRLLQFGMEMIEGNGHSTDLLCYDGFNNQIDRRRAGLGFSGSWSAGPAFEGVSVGFDGLSFASGDGRVDLSGDTTVRKMANPVDMASQDALYVSMLVSAKGDNVDDMADEDFTFELKDAQGDVQCSFGVNSAEALTVNSIAVTDTDFINKTKAYYLVIKLQADKVYVKAFVDGQKIVNAESGNYWTASGDIDAVSIIDSIAMTAGENALWSVDEIRVGTSYEAVVGDVSNCDVFFTGDINKDCYVNLEDFMVLVSQWLQCSDAANPDCL
ncbi:MAG: exo-alpha-sialidase [Phycisphaerae bacterium]|nr:exo-alpha-sialidase [Phycisphaerae bacterium]